MSASAPENQKDQPASSRAPNSASLTRRSASSIPLRSSSPSPIWIPPVYELHQRTVDTDGFINLHRVRYSVPYRLIGRELEVRELKDSVEIYDGPRTRQEHRASKLSFPAVQHAIQSL